jgi:acetyl-CoA decarbonylase/synthase, CODH/ACS complex subunit gamma
MALTGIQIFKLLPKTNCKECGVPTCLAFAMNLASGKAELDSCPYVSAEAREQLAEASAPPIRPVVIGQGVRKLTVGGELVLSRHEKNLLQSDRAGCTGRLGHPAGRAGGQTEDLERFSV